MPERSPDSPGLKLLTLDVIVNELVQDLQGRGRTPELPTGIERLDDAVWGIHRSELTVISARPGEGKTTLAIQISKHLSDRRKRVCFISLEMTKHQLAERLLVQLTKANAWDLRRGRKVEEFVQKLTPLASFFREVNLRLIDSTGYTIAEVREVIKQIHERTKQYPDVLVIDFIQLIALEGGLQRYDAIAEYMRGLKELSIRCDMAIVVCSQINRESAKNEGRRPKLSNLKGSGAIEELADCVIMCWWEELGKENRPEGYKYWFLVEKQRHGPPGQMIPVRFIPEQLSFVNVEDRIADWSAEVKEVEQTFPGSVVQAENEREGSP